MSTTTRASVRLVSEGTYLVDFPDDTTDTVVHFYQARGVSWWRCEKNGIQVLGSTVDCVHIQAVRERQP